MSIKDWKEDDRPREKFLAKGKQAMSDSELLAILIGMGTKESSALDIARVLLADNQHSLQKLGQLSLQELMKYKGLGPSKAVTIAAALELGSRRVVESPENSPICNSSEKIFQILRSQFQGLRWEEFYIIHLTKGLKLIKVERLSVGKTDATIVDVKRLVKSALDNLSHSIVIAHNHPSGTLEPSKEDIALTQQLQSALSLMDIKLVDHLIVSESTYLSFADEGRL